MTISSNLSDASHKKSKPKPPSPFCIRLSEAEKALLKARAGRRPLSVYAREKLLGDSVEPRKACRRAPDVDEVMLARVLAALGASRLSANLNQIAKGVNTGSLPVSPELESELRGACTAVQAMRASLVSALGLKDHQGGGT